MVKLYGFKLLHARRRHPYIERDSLCSEGESHMTRGSMPMREPVPASWTRTYSGSAKATHVNKSGFGFVEVYNNMQAKTIKS